MFLWYLSKLQTRRFPGGEHRWKRSCRGRSPFYSQLTGVIQPIRGHVVSHIFNVRFRPRIPQLFR